MRLFLIAVISFLCASRSWAAVGPEINLMRVVDNKNIINGNNEAIPSSIASRPLLPNRYYIIENLGDAPLIVNPPPIPRPFVTLSNVFGGASSHPSTIPGAFSYDFNVVVVPLRPGPWQMDLAYIVCNDADESPFSWRISGTAARTPGRGLLVSKGGSAILDDYTMILVGGSVNSDTLLTVPKKPAAQTVTYTLENIGTGPLTVSNIAFGAKTNCEMTLLTPLPIVINQGATADFQVSFSGIATGSGANAEILVFSNDEENRSTYNWYLAAIAVVDAPEIEVKENAFFEVTDGDALGGPSMINGVPTRARTVTYDVKNTGSAPLSVAETVTSANSTIVSATWSGSIPIPVGETRTLTIVYYPNLPSPPGTYLVNVSLATNDADENPFNWTISGHSSVPLPDFSLRSDLNARDIPKGGLDVTSNLAIPGGATLSYTIKNIGFDDLVITNISKTSESGCVATLVTPAFPMTIPPGATDSFDLDITAISADAVWKASITLATNSPGEASFPFLATSYSAPNGSGGGSGKECGFGTPFGALLIAFSGLLFTRRRGI